MKYFVSLLFALVFVSACKKDVSPDRINLPPRTNFVLLNANGTELLTSTSTPLRISTTANSQYIELGAECAGGGCTMIREFTPSSTQPHRFVYGSVGLTDYSLKQEQIWHLTLNGKTDTLRYQLQYAPSNMNTVVQVVKATFNGQTVQPEVQLLDQFDGPFFVLRRQH